MKPINPICVLIIAATLVPLNAEEQQRVTIKDSSASDGVVSLHAEIAGKPHSFDCFKSASSCSLVQPGEYVMVKANVNEGVYNDCTNVVLYKASSGVNEKVGVYCWSSSGDCYIVCPTEMHVDTTPSSLPDKIVETSVSDKAELNGGQLIAAETAQAICISYMGQSDKSVLGISISDSNRGIALCRKGSDEAWEYVIDSKLMSRLIATAEQTPSDEHDRAGHLWAALVFHENSKRLIILDNSNGELLLIHLQKSCGDGSLRTRLKKLQHVIERK